MIGRHREGQTAGSDDSPTEEASDSPSLPWQVLATALAVVVLGTAWFDNTRLALLWIPATLLIAAYTIGSGLSHFSDKPPDPNQPVMPHVAVRLGVGIACLSLLATLSALAGMLWLAGGVILLMDAAGFTQIARAVRLRRPPYSLVPVTSGVILGVVWLIAWLWATIPSTFYDELAYHLVIPERALATGSLQASPWVLFTLMPHASDLLLAWGMAADGDLGARALHWSFWAWGSLAAWGLLEALRWPRSSQWTAALIAGALASAPTLWFLGTLTFAETCLTASLVTAACAMVTSDRQNAPWLPTGLLLGLAATVKLNGLAWSLAGLAAGFVLGWSRRNLALATLLALASVIPWWGRAAWITGNPVYPLAYEWLGGNGFWSDANQTLLKGDLSANAADLGPAGTLRLPWDLIMHSERFGSAADAGFLAIVATSAVLLLPVLTRIAHAGPRMRRLGDAASAFVFIAGGAWAATATTTRFFAPALLLGLVVFLGLILSFRKAGTVLALAVIIPLGIWGTVRFLDQHEAIFSSTRVALGKEERNSYLARTLDQYEAAAFVRHKVPASATLLFIGEARPYYFSREAVAPYPFNRHPLGAWVQESDSPEALAERLAREHITHVILNVREFRRLHDKYGVLKFTGARADEYDDRLKQLPRALHQLFSKNHVYVFEVSPVR